MAVKFPFVSAFLCEKILQEKDGINTAIRIVDIFNIAADAPPDAGVHFFGFVSLKTAPVPDSKVTIRVAIVSPIGTREYLPDAPDQPYSLSVFEGDPTVPTGLMLVFEINIIPKNLGTGYLEIEADGEVAVRLPFTIRRLPPAQSVPEQRK
jgi:hypothetical protein